MNVEDPAVLAAFVAQLKSAADEFVDRLSAALQSNLSTGASDLTAIADQLAVSAQALETKTVNDLDQTISELDGWTLDIGPITIPAFSIRLNKPASK